jgi:shikimate dehydrogenase
MSWRLGVVGYPIEHSISPAIHQAALDHLGIDARYERWSVAPADLAAWAASLRAADILGANVTIPHKEALIALLDELDASARQIGAVNTVLKQDDRLIGANTDAAGFRRALADAGYAPRNGEAVMLGAGGAARAVGHALLAAGVLRLAIFNRDAGRARALASVLSGRGPRRGSGARGQGAGEEDTPATPHLPSPIPQPLIEAFALDAPALDARLANCDLLVNTTSVGMRPGERLLRPEQVPAQALVVDIVYRPAETTLLADAARRGARTQNGLPMLVYQAAIAFERWTGREAPLDVMFAAARQALA